MTENKDKLKELIEKRYAKQEELADKRVAEVLSDLTHEVYVPVVINNENYLAKIEFEPVIEGGIFVKSKSKAVVQNIVPLTQKVIAMRHPKDQSDLKFYYEQGEKLVGGKK